MSALLEMYVQGVSTRKVKAITEELCGHSFSASTVSEVTARLDQALKAFFEQRLAEPYPYLILDAALRAGARSRRDRQPGGAGGDRRRLGGPAPVSNWPTVRAIRAGARSWQGSSSAGAPSSSSPMTIRGSGQRSAKSCPSQFGSDFYVLFLRNALDYVPRKVDDDCLMELRWFYDRRDLAEVKRDPAQWIAKWQAKYPKLVNWVEDNIEETLSFYRLRLPITST